MKLMKSFSLMAICLLIVSLIANAAVPVRPVGANDAEMVLGAVGKRYLVEMTAVPNSNTPVTTEATKVQVLLCSNITAGAVVLSVTNTAGTQYLPSVSLPANSTTMVFGSSVGFYMNGIKWQAGSSNSIFCQIEGVQ